MPVRGDGFCFLNAIEVVQYCDYSEVVMVNSLGSIILGHLAANVDYYKWFCTGDILWNAEGYFIFGNYSDIVIDLIIIATTKVLNMNLPIYQKGQDGNIHIIEQTINARGRQVHLKFTLDPHNPTKNHYDAILLLHKPVKVFDHDEHNFENPNSASLQLIMQDYADEVIDLTDDSETTFMQHNVNCPYNNHKVTCNSPLTHLLT